MIRCPECNAGNGLSTIKGHYKHKHPQAYEGKFGEPLPTKFRCPKGCGWECADKKDVRDHLLKKHGEEDPRFSSVVNQVKRLPLSLLKERLASEAGAHNAINARIIGVEAALFSFTILPNISHNKFAIHQMVISFVPAFSPSM